MRDAVGPGFDPNSRDRLTAIGNTIAPVRAVLDAVTGASTRSVSDSA